jgi:hypothetical protein
VFQAGVAVIERDSPVESLIDLDFGAGEAEAAWGDIFTLPLRGDRIMELRHCA